MRCEVCEDEAAAGELNRIHGLDVCDACRLAPQQRRLPWGRVYVAENWKRVRTGNSSSKVVQILEVEANSSVVLPVVSFSRESLGWLHRLFAQEIQVGDPLFDDAVWISTDDQRDAARLLAVDGVQSAVLDAVMMPATLKLDATSVSLRSESVPGHAPGEVGLLALSIVRHATRLLGPDNA